MCLSIELKRAVRDTTLLSGVHTTLVLEFRFSKGCLKTNIRTEVFRNRKPQMILAFADVVDALGGNTVCKMVGL